MFLPGLDLNFEPVICQPAMNIFAGVIDAYRQAGFCAVNGASAADDVSSLCGAIWGTSQGQAFHLFGSVPLHGLCATDVSREPARHRSLSACSVLQTLSLGFPQRGGAQHPGQRQRNSRLAHLLRLRPELDRNGPKALCQRTLWGRSERYRLRSGRHHHRSVPVGVSVGAVSLDQGGHPAAHAAGLEGQYSFLHSHQRWQVARSQLARRTDCRAGSLLRDGSRLYRLRALGPTQRSGQLLCYTRQVQSQSPAPLLPQSGSNSIFGSKRFSVSPKTPSRLKSGSPSPFTCSWPSSKNDSTYRRLSTNSYRF